jgi:polyisoprenoid-binding protein YceI
MMDVERWSIDRVDFDVTASWGLTLARGHFERAAGWYETGPDGARLELVVDAGSAVTGNRMWDDLLRSSAPSALAEHPEVRFTSTRVGDSGQGHLHVEGRLDAAGKVVPVAFDAVVRPVDQGLQLESVVKVDGHQLGTPATVHLRAHLAQIRPGTSGT